MELLRANAFRLCVIVSLFPILLILIFLENSSAPLKRGRMAIYYGYIIIEVATYVSALLSRFDPLVDNKYGHFINVLIAIGYLLMMLNLVFSLKELVLFSIAFSSMVCFLLALSAGIGGIFLNHNTKGWLEIRLNNAINNYGTINGSAITKSFDDVQSELGCCGIYNFTDWDPSAFSSVSNIHRGLPLTCCEVPHGTFKEFFCNSSSATLHRTGCLEKFGDYILDCNYYILYGGFGSAVILVMFFLLALYSLRSSRASGYEEM